jgi:selenocysteine-specific elongation factor
MNAVSPTHQSLIEIPFVIGTAGHVDHGKSTLVKALTGIDPDRLAEEREREMTIDLGFAVLALPDGRAVSIIDVPGHERFVRNMLAGVGGIDLAMLVIAADDGPMPQTREHLAILDLLGVERGVVVISRTDLVDDEWRDLVIEEARELIRGTSLADAPIVPVSAVTGAGLDDLRATIAAELDRATARDAGGRARLPVDRAFPVAGFGTVVTGTLIGGEIRVGEELMLYPERRPVRVRGLQAHGQQVEVARAGSRVAINLGGVDRHEVRRGTVIAPAGSLTPSLRFDARVRVLDASPVALEQNDELIVFIGADEVPARLSLLDCERIEPGEEGWVQLRLAHAATAVRGDRLVLRRPSPAVTIGGGMVVDPAPPRHKRMQAELIASLEVLRQGTPEDLIDRALGDRAGDIGGLARSTGVQDAERVIAGMVERGELVPLSDEPLTAKTLVMRASAFDRAEAQVTAFLDRYHAAQPLVAGARRDEVGAAVGIRAQRPLDELLHALARRGAIRLDGPIVAAPGFAIALQADDRARADRFLTAARAEPFSPPPPSEFGLDDAVLGALVAIGEIVRVADQIAYPADVFTRIRDGVVAALDRDGTISLAGYRDLFDTSRKYAQPTLEWLDAHRITRRKGDVRVRFRGPGAGA